MRAPPILSALLLAAVLLGTLACGSEPEPPAPCNGDAALCSRSLPEVVLPGTHNSMSNDDEGWSVPNQTFGLARQLEDGVRAMLLDTHEWQGGLWLCHAACELGATPLVEGLGTIAAFLDAHPREVMVLILQDATTVAETVAAIDASGLGAHVYRGDPAAGWPTLEEMIASGERVLVSAEFSGPPPAWYHHAWDLFRDTPYSFAALEEFSCAHNRGDPAAPLYLLNHWIGNSLADPDAAAEANTAAVLGARAAECQAESGRLPNIVAVDFYDLGDLFEVVADLNGLR
ncbi:MAG: hypothetical protein P1V51_07250 [Deltaproteobacteria bacterium]|nr:hypothetical protein [Deltaproteobacteria bacterium]